MFLLEGHTERINDGSVAFSPDGRLLVSGDKEGVARIWDLESRAEHKVLEGHESNLTGARFIRDGKGLVTCGHDRTLRFWDVASGRELHRVDTDRLCIYEA